MTVGRGTSQLPARYWRQWWASAVSNIGDGVSFAAMPLLAYSLTEDERVLSLTTFALIVPWLVLALPVGVAVDRGDRRVLMVGANVVRLVLFGVVAVTVAAGSLSIWVLLALLVLVGACEVVFDSSAQAFLPTLVSSGDLPRANGYLLAAEVVAGSLVGLSVGAYVFNAVAMLPFLLNALSFAVAAVLILSIHVPATIVHDPTGSRTTDRGERDSVRGGVRDGVALLLAEPLLRTLAGLLAVMNLAFMLGQGIFVKYAAVELGVSAGAYGLLLAVTAIGAATGAVLGHRLVRRIGTVPGIVVPAVVFGAGQLLIGLVPVTGVVAATGFCTGAAITIWNVVTVSLRQQMIPSHVFGRVNSVYRWVGTGASAVGALLGGQIAYHVGLRAPFLVAGGATLVALAIGLTPIIVGVRTVDASPTTPTTPTPTPTPTPTEHLPDQVPADLTPAPPSMT
jgi:MFS family permease